MVSTGGALDGSQISAGMRSATEACSNSEASELPAIVREPTETLMVISSEFSSLFERATAAGRDGVGDAVTKTNIVLYQTDWCPYCVRVRSELERLGLEYEIVNVPDEHEKRTILKEMFGETGVPSITDGEVKIADDDDAIVDYLLDAYG
jgi:glutaredoxin 3